MPHAISEGTRIYYEAHGQAGDPLLLIMGLGGDRHFWEFQVPELARAHRVVLFDNRGVGGSDKPKGPYSMARMAEDARAVLDAAAVARAHVLGISMGGMIAQELALAHPDRVGALVLACTLAKLDEGDQRSAEQGAEQLGAPSPLAMLKDGKGMDPEALKQIDPKQMFKFMTQLVLSPEFIAREKEWLRSLFQRTQGSGSTPEHFFAQLGAIMKHDTTTRLHGLRAPTLILTGDSDKLVPPRHSDQLHGLIPGSRLVRMTGGTHGFNIEQKEAFNRAVLDHLRAHPL